MTAGIILAAGASRRMGRNKLRFTIDGESLIRRAVTRALEAGLSPIIVVVGHEAEAVRRELAGLTCQFAASPDAAGPTSGSLHAGLNALATDIPAAVVILADMPLVTAAMLRTMTDVAARDPAPVVASRYGGTLAPPLLFRRSVFPELLAWYGEGCGKQAVLRHQADAVFLDWPADALADVDTPDDCRALGVDPAP